MSRKTFRQIFQQAYSAVSRSPYDYQSRLACGEGKESATAGTACASLLISVPTGLGKTAAAVLAWIWNRVLQPEVEARGKWPRRLIYCLPMRTLVEQTEESVRAWLESLGLLWDGQSSHDGKVGLHILMGGEEASDWDLFPEDDAIIIGTQDMLLSRALNRGYGMSRYRWPLPFGLLNNDCLWVFDETQLMGVGLETGAQLGGFRERFGAYRPSFSWWMSATLDPTRLETSEAGARPATFSLSEAEQQMPEVQRRLGAVKRVRRSEATFAASPQVLAKEVCKAHVPGTLTLVVVNTVERAQELFRALRKEKNAEPVYLLHSRFRPHEREQIAQAALKGPEGRIVVSTQVVEAGVDISARTLFTELAPWSSLVQRFGRCHRYGEMTESGADIVWLDVPDDKAAPYAAEVIAAARGLVAELQDAAPASLAAVAAPRLEEPPRHVIRPKDLVELFDTTADMAGADLDISRFIRDQSDDTDCMVFWRSDAPKEDERSGPVREELCPVSVGRLRDWLGKRPEKIWTWDALDRRWEPARQIVPGREYWLESSLGGYDVAVGFDRKSGISVAPVVAATAVAEGYDDEPATLARTAQTLEQHTLAVIAAVDRLGLSLALQESLRALLHTAAVWHDVGKAHVAFQEALRAVDSELAAEQIWAKSGATAPLKFSERRHFRHELASALSWRAQAPFDRDAALVAFLIAAHHGKVRLSLRALPSEQEPQDPDCLFARGVWDGDVLPALQIENVAMLQTSLSLGAMRLGQGEDGRPSWAESCLALRDAPDLGPFRLAFLEAIFRAADMRASAL